MDYLKEIEVEFFPSNSTYCLFNTHDENPLPIQDRKTSFMFYDVRDLTNKVYRNCTKQKVDFKFNKFKILNVIVRELLERTNIRLYNIYYSNIYNDEIIELNQYFLGNIQMNYIKKIRIVFSL